MTISFSYDKKQVLQALRYHFITRSEIRILLIVVNVFAILSAVLAYMHIIQPISFMIFSFLWFTLIIVIWRVLPMTIYKKSETFQDSFNMRFSEQEVVLGTSRGTQAWHWQDFSSFMESPYFFHLYFNSRSFFLVPKEAFSGIIEIQAARQLFRDKIKK